MFLGGEIYTISTKREMTNVETEVVNGFSEENNRLRRNEKHVHFEVCNYHCYVVCITKKHFVQFKPIRTLASSVGGVPN